MYAVCPDGCIFRRCKLVQGWIIGVTGIFIFHRQASYVRHTNPSTGCPVCCSRTHGTFRQIGNFKKRNGNIREAISWTISVMLLMTSGMSCTKISCRKGGVYLIFLQASQYLPSPFDGYSHLLFENLSHVRAEHRILRISKLSKTYLLNKIEKVLPFHVSVPFCASSISETCSSRYVIVMAWIFTFFLLCFINVNSVSNKNCYNCWQKRFFQSGWNL